MRTKKEIIKQTEEFLDERYMISQMEDSRPQDVSYYNGAIKALEFLGYSWKRNENGKHAVIKE